MRIRFDPATTGAKAATLTIDSDAPDLEVELSGTGTQTELSRTPPSLAFGSRDVDNGPTDGADGEAHQHGDRGGHADRLRAVR